MKTISTSRINPLKNIRKQRKLSIFMSVLLSIAMINLTSCGTYYRVSDMTTTESEIKEKIQIINTQGYYAIVQSGNEYFHLGGLKIDQENNMINGIAKPRNAAHIYPKERKLRGSNKFKTSVQSPTTELHIKLKDSIKPTYYEDINIQISNIESVSFNSRQYGKEFGLVMLGAAASVGVIIGLIALLKSSCPFVYVKKDDTFYFVGELYPGNITENMQRDDFIPLGAYEGDLDEFVIMVTNELKEIQHTDYLQLIVVDHDKNIEVLLDEKGQLFSFDSLNEARKVIIDDNHSGDEVLKAKDDKVYAFNNANVDSEGSKRRITLEFDIPENTKEAKIYLTARNSMWLDYMFGKFNQQFGTDYQKYQDYQQSRTKTQADRWMKSQNIPLSVFVETSSGWELIKDINPVGPLAYRNLVVPIDPNFLNGDTVSLKLETGFMFWEVDYLGIDYSENKTVNVNYFSPESAKDHNGIDVTDLITEKDKDYFVQSEIGDEAIISFKLEGIQKTPSHSVFLQNRGYYRYIRDYEGEPNMAALRTFRNEGALSDFSKYEYFALMGITSN